MKNAVVLLYGGLDSIVCAGLGLWLSMAIAVAVTLALYALRVWAAPRLGLKL
jgi:7-cyano-7-deazaguanine synthase in queuosine biosynthesis